MQETQVQSLYWEDPLEREWQPTPVFLPRELHGQKSLVGYSPWDCIEFMGSQSRIRLSISLSLFSSCLENPRDGGAWWAAVYEVAQSQTQLK